MIKQKTSKEIAEEINWYESHLEATNEAIAETVKYLENLAAQKTNTQIFSSISKDKKCITNF